MVHHLLDGYGFREQHLSLHQLLSLLQDVAQVIHGVDVGRVQSGSRGEENRKQRIDSIKVGHSVDGREYL